MYANLADPQLQFLQSVVASGKYRDESDALNEAVLLLQRREELRAMLEQGENELDQGLVVSGEDVFAALELRAAELDRAASRPQA